LSPHASAGPLLIAERRIKQVREADARFLQAFAD
jgi:hypothetical protein